MGIRSCAGSVDGLINGQLGDAYADVQLVAQNLDALIALADVVDTIVTAANDITTNVNFVTGARDITLTYRDAAQTSATNAAASAAAANGSAVAAAASAAAALTSENNAETAAATATQAAIDALAIAGGDIIFNTERGVANGIAELGPDGNIVPAQMPAYVESVVGLGGAVTAAQIKAAVAYAKADVGLPLADNTSDADKPVSTAQAAALALKADLTYLNANFPEWGDLVFGLGEKSDTDHNHDATYQKKATISTLDPSGGAAGDIWFKVV